MRPIERRVVESYLATYPKDASFDEIVDVLKQAEGDEQLPKGYDVFVQYEGLNLVMIAHDMREEVVSYDEYRASDREMHTR